MSTPTTVEQTEKSNKTKARSFRKDGRWFLTFAEDVIWGPIDNVIETVMVDRKTEERELDATETTELLLQFA